MFVNYFQQNGRICTTTNNKKPFQGSKGNIGEKPTAEDYGVFFKALPLDLIPSSGFT